MSEIHDLNNHNCSKFTGHGPEYRRVMETQKVPFTKLLKLHSAQLVVARNEEEQDGTEELDEDIIQIIHLHESDPQNLTNLRSLMLRALGVDLKLATDGACSKMRWKVFASSARTHHVRMKNWPAGLPGIGPKADGLVENVKSFNKANLVAWMDSRVRYWKAAGKSEDDCTEADEAILKDGFEGPYIEAWTDKEVNGDVDEGDIPVIVDEDGHVVLCVRDIVKDKAQDDDDDESERNSRGTKKPAPAASSNSRHRPTPVQNDSDNDLAQAAPVSRRHSKKPIPAVASSSKQLPSVRNTNDDGDEDEDSSGHLPQPSRKSQQPAASRNDSDSDESDEEDFVPPPRSRQQQSQQDDSDDSDYITLPKPLKTNKGKRPVSSTPSVPRTTTACPANLPLPPRS
ncbi:hypothetical protein VKT23_017863 [Stygiomarasmius scandens]|uniref:Uncharacterized protein n=1 Tax=Marasmiellus scandens TaxID=2682957 RepID=A0ABR1IR05_9AGAR